MRVRLIDKTEEFSSAYSAASAVYNVADLGCDSFSCSAEIDVDTPSAVVVPSADITFATCNFEYADHGLSEGLKVQVSTSDTLPDGITALTDYFVIVVDEDNFKLASSLSNAQAGTALTLLDAGVGDQTVTPVALAGGTIKLEQANSLSGPWYTIGSATNITVDADVLLEKDRPTTRFIRVYITLTAGHISANLQVLGKGDRQ